MKLALITAGYHRLGGAIAARLAAAGWTLALHSRGVREPEAGLAAVLKQHGTTWHGFEADLSDDSAVMQMIPAVIAHYGRAPDLLVNNASLFEWDNPASVTPQAEQALWPKHAKLYTLAATKQKTVNAKDLLQPIKRLLGDGLVPVKSALAIDAHTRLGLARPLPATRQAVIYATDHFELLSSPLVAQQLIRWL